MASARETRALSLLARGHWAADLEVGFEGSPAEGKNVYVDTEVSECVFLLDTGDEVWYFNHC